MTENILSWNIPNFITVGVMAVVMFAVFGMITSAVRGRSAEA